MSTSAPSFPEGALDAVTADVGLLPSMAAPGHQNDLHESAWEITEAAIDLSFSNSVQPTSQNDAHRLALEEATRELHLGALDCAYRAHLASSPALLLPRPNDETALEAAGRAVHLILENLRSAASVPRYTAASWPLIMPAGPHSAHTVDQVSAFANTFASLLAQAQSAITQAHEDNTREHPGRPHFDASNFPGPTTVTPFPGTAIQVRTSILDSLGDPFTLAVERTSTGGLRLHDNGALAGLMFSMNKSGLDSPPMQLLTRLASSRGALVDLDEALVIIHTSDSRMLQDASQLLAIITTVTNASPHL